jgi:hypothetical protein
MKRPATSVHEIPSKIEAAEFLRDLARNAGKPLADGKQRAADLRLIADLIEGKVKWRKVGKHLWKMRIRINHAAMMVDRRPAGTSISDALDMWAHKIADELHIVSPAKWADIRCDIDAARKRRRAYLAAHPLEK